MRSHPFQFAGIALLLISVVLLLFYHRRWLLMGDGSVSASRARITFSCIMLLTLAGLAAVYAALVSSEWRRAAYSVLPLIVLSCYGLETYLITRLPIRWKTSPAFWMAAVAPLLGFVLVILILWRERYEDRR